MYGVVFDDAVESQMSAIEGGDVFVAHDVSRGSKVKYAAKSSKTTACTRIYKN
jgi:hypothetical protein